MTTPMSELRESLARHNTKFGMLLALIPPEMYLEHEQDPDAWKSKFQKNKKGQAPKQGVKEATKKAKRAKLDPANHKTMLDVQREAAEEELSSKQHAKGKGKARIVEEEAEEDEVIEYDPLQTRKPLPKRQSVADLRNKLHSRIADLRQGRNADGHMERSPKETLLDEHRREKQQAEAKQKQREKGKGQQQPHQNRLNFHLDQLIVPHVGRYRPSEALSDNRAPSSQQPSFTNIQFSTLSSKSSGDKPFKPTFGTSKDPKRALKQLVAREEQLASLPTDLQGAAREKAKWEKAQARLDGEKVRDDVAQLKRVIKRKEKDKVRGKEKWTERKEAVANDMAARQRKRTDNIALRHDKRKKASKSRPGFEGGKTFLGVPDKKKHHKSKSPKS